MATRKKKAPDTPWFTALKKQKLDVRTARDAAAVVGWLDTGNYALNWAISARFNRGYPLGHTVEVFGDPSTGKSFILARAMARAQSEGGVALLDDTEGAYNPDWMETLGINADHLAYRHSRTVKDHLEVTLAFLKAYADLTKLGKVKGPGVLCCDSLALLSTEHELEVGLDKRDMSKAAELKAFFRIVSGDINKLRVVHISANHTIANIGNAFQKRTTPGGGGPKFQATVRIDLRTVTKIKNDVEYIGVLCRAVVDKNRIAPPWKEIRLAIPFHQPISRASGLIPVLLDLGILSLDGSKQFLRYEGKKLGVRAFQARDKVLRQDEEAERLLDLVPEILDDADIFLAEQTPAMPTATIEPTDTDGDEE